MQVFLRLVETSHLPRGIEKIVMQGEVTDRDEHGMLLLLRFGLFCANAIGLGIAIRFGIGLLQQLYESRFIAGNMHCFLKSCSKAIAAKELGNYAILTEQCWNNRL